MNTSGHRLGQVTLTQKNKILTGLHQHDIIELNIVRSGVAQYFISGKRVHIKKNSLLWILPNEKHTIIDYTKNFSMWVVVFERDVFDGIDSEGLKRYKLIEEGASQLYCKILSDDSVKYLDWCLQSIRENFEDVSYFNVSLQYLLFRSWELYQQSEELPQSSSIHGSVDEAARILIERDLSLTEIAEQVGLSPNHLSRLFKDEMGMKLNEYRNKCRLDRFFKIYDNGQKVNALHAALEAGFGSYAQFYRICKEITGKKLRDII